MKSGIYLIKNVINGKLYVGSSSHLTNRWSSHRVSLRENTHCNKKLQNGYNKYGAEAFTYSILELCEIDQLLTKEQYWMDLLNPWYNILKVAGRTTGHQWVPETYKKRKKTWFSKTELEKQIIRDKQSAASLGKPKSEETKAKMRKPKSEETKKKMSETWLKIRKERKECL